MVQAMLWKVVRDQHIKERSMISIQKELLKGRYGDFYAYTISGDTRPIKDRLSALGFKWYAQKGVWWMSEKNYTPSVKATVESLVGTSTESISNSDQPIAPKQEKRTSMETEDPVASKFYGFPINKDIYKFTMDFTIDGKTMQKEVTIDRSFAKDQDGRKKMAYKGIPVYVFRIQSLSEEPLIFKSTPEQKWGAYDEEYFLKAKEESWKKAIAEPNTKLYAKLKSDYKIDKVKRERTPELKQYFQDIQDKKIDPRFDVNIEDPTYKGSYPAKIDSWSIKPDSIHCYMSTELNHPLAPRGDNLGEIDLIDVLTMEDFQNAMRSYLSSPKPQKEYLDFLKSFPFLQEQQEKANQSFTTVMGYLENKNVSSDDVLRKLQELGYIRPSKRQKGGEGLTMGDEIKWVIESKKIVNDAYSFGGYKANTPDYFFSMIAYYIHRQIRGIRSWTDMMLMDSMRKFYETIYKMNPNISFKEMQSAIETIGNDIVSKIYGKETQQQKDEKFRNWFDGQGDNKTESPTALNEFAQFVGKYGIDVTDLSENAKKIYRQLVMMLHPDTVQDPVEKDKKTEEFKALQNIWDKVPEMYKVASNWYERHIFS